MRLAKYLLVCALGIHWSLSAVAQTEAPPARLTFQDILDAVDQATPEQKQQLKQKLDVSGTAAVVGQTLTSRSGSEAATAGEMPVPRVQTAAEKPILPASLPPTKEGDSPSSLLVLRNQPGPQSPLGGQGIQLQAGSSNGSVQAKFLFPGTESFTLTLSAPTSASSSGDPVKLATLDGLANSFSAKVAYTKLRNWEKNDAIHFQLFGVSAQTGYQSFSFTDPNKLTKDSDSRTPSGASIYYGIGQYIQKDEAAKDKEARGAAVVKYTYQNSYAAASTKVLCPSPAASPPTTCANGPIGSPIRSIVRRTSIELFYTTNDDPRKGVSFAPVLSYDQTSKVKGIDLPIYLKVSGDSSTTTSSKTALLNFGIDIGWRNDTHGTFGLFVGTPIDITRQ